jgi:hypothetical protein
MYISHIEKVWFCIEVVGGFIYFYISLAYSASFPDAGCLPLFFLWNDKASMCEHTVHILHIASNTICCIYSIWYIFCIFWYFNSLSTGYTNFQMTNSKILKQHRLIICCHHLLLQCYTSRLIIFRTCNHSTSMILFTKRAEILRLCFALFKKKINEFGVLFAQWGILLLCEAMQGNHGNACHIVRSSYCAFLLHILHILHIIYDTFHFLQIKLTMEMRWKTEPLTMTGPGLQCFEMGNDSAYQCTQVRQICCPIRPARYDCSGSW